MADFIQRCARIVKGVSIVDNVVILRKSLPCFGGSMRATGFKYLYQQTRFY